MRPWLDVYLRRDLSPASTLPTGAESWQSGRAGSRWQTCRLHATISDQPAAEQQAAAAEPPATDMCCTPACIERDRGL